MPKTPEQSEALEYRIGKLSIVPGEVVVIKIDRDLSLNDMVRARNAFTGLLPADTPIVVLDRHTDLYAISGINHRKL